MISPDLVKQCRPRLAKIWTEAAISKNCQVLQWNGSSDSEDGSLPSETASNQCPMCFREALRKINLTLGDLWSIKDLMEHFTRGKTLTSVSWPDCTVLVRTSLEHFGSSFAFLTLSWVPGSLSVPSEFKWVLPTKSCIGFGPRISSLLYLLSAVHWKIHQKQMGFCSGLILMLSGEWELLELQNRSGNQKAT